MKKERSACPFCKKQMRENKLEQHKRDSCSALPIMTVLAKYRVKSDGDCVWCGGWSDRLGRIQHKVWCPQQPSSASVNHRHSTKSGYKSRSINKKCEFCDQKIPRERYVVHLVEECSVYKEYISKDKLGDDDILTQIHNIGDRISGLVKLTNSLSEQELIDLISMLEAFCVKEYMCVLDKKPSTRFAEEARSSHDAMYKAYRVGSIG